MNNEASLMKHSNDYDWVDTYEELMGIGQLIRYYQRVLKFFLQLPEGREVKIAKIVQPQNRDLFIKCVCRIIYEDRVKLQFTKRYTHILKLKQQYGSDIVVIRETEEKVQIKRTAHAT